MSVSSFVAAPIAGSTYLGLKSNNTNLFPAKDTITWNRKTISNGSKTYCMKNNSTSGVWRDLRATQYNFTLGSLPPRTSNLALGVTRTHNLPLGSGGCSPLDQPTLVRKSYCNTWNPIDNKKFETLSYLPPLSEDSIAKEVDYMIQKGWIPCLEFDQVGYVRRENSSMPGYYDGRYWTLWKLPMFGCNDSSQVLNEIQDCKKAYPNAFIRCLAFDNVKQVQCMAFLIQKPVA